MLLLTSLELINAWWLILLQHAGASHSTESTPYGRTQTPTHTPFMLPNRYWKHACKFYSDYLETYWPTNKTVTQPVFLSTLLLIAYYSKNKPTNKTHNNYNHTKKHTTITIWAIDWNMCFLIHLIICMNSALDGALGYSRGRPQRHGPSDPMHGLISYSYSLDWMRKRLVVQNKDFKT